jgi:uncharacterized protein
MTYISLDNPSISKRVEALPWEELRQTLDIQGFAKTGPLLTPEECREVIKIYDRPTCFRSRVIMQKHRFGKGEYQYFAYPLPSMVQSLREAVYAHLFPLANAWNELLAKEFAFPDTLEAFLETCHRAEQLRPTPLVLKYQAGDFNYLGLAEKK